MTRVPAFLAGMSAVALFVTPGAWAQDGGQDQESLIPDAIQLPTPTPTPADTGIVAIPAGRQGGGDSAIGPDSLSNFSLGGPTPTPTPVRRPTPAPTPVATAPTRSNPAATPPPVRTGSPVTRPSQPPVGATGSAGRLTPVPLNPFNPGRSRGAEDVSPLDLPPPPDGLTAPESGMANWPWLLALLGVIGAGLFAWQLRRQRTATAGGPALERSTAPQPAPTPASKPVPPQPAAPPVTPTGTITTSALKPELTVEVEPVRAVFSDEGFSLDYRLTIANIGHGAAQRPTIRQDWLFASATQAEEFDEFLARPVGELDKPLPQSIPPQSAIRLDARAIMPLDKARVFIVEDRKLFLPILALGVRHGHQSPAQKPAANGMWLIGRAGGSDGRMAPIRADQGARIIRDIQLKRQ